jgi:hypothetical protein
MNTRAKRKLRLHASYGHRFNRALRDGRARFSFQWRGVFAECWSIKGSTNND